MLRRTFCTMLLVAAFGTVVFTDSAAQPALKDHEIMVSEHTTIRDIGSWFGRTFHPVRILDASRPQMLLVGEEGLFSIQANVESASLPIVSVWEFSDGALKKGLNVRHTFKRPGTYEVLVRVSNRGSEVTQTFEVEVRPDESRG